MEKYQDPIDMQTALDCAIREFERKNGGYTMTKSGTTYCNYMSDTEWKDYLKDMEPIHKAQYSCGGGGELYPGKYPPKMASFGSSSRFIYELSKNISGFKFEEKLDTKVGGVANLDGFIKTKDKYIYIEAKRREIYGASHANEKIKVVYEDVYNTIQKLVNNFNYKMYGEKDEEGYKKCTFKISGEVVKYFDIKQLICHFLGITYDIAKHEIENAKVIFVYLIYNPNEVKGKLQRYEKNIETRYENVATFINKNAETIKNIFNAVLNYQTERHKLPKTSIDFEFFLVDQYNYKDILK